VRRKPQQPPAILMTDSDHHAPGAQEHPPPPPPSGNWVLKQVRRWIIFTLGMTVLSIGLVMIFTPGPAFVVIPLGLAILATEFLWARKILKTLKERLTNTTKTP
jgi:Putative transmembrane protein (PGPGW)